ncbi:MAG: hypothetical protein J6V57_05435 [Spirochaetaceae bacterium]|nr:hypothetical protein [Spirochaetaceae bacterium]
MTVSSSKKFSFILISLLMTLTVWSQAHLSTQAHQDTVNKVAVTKDGSVFSAGKDGFLIRWTEDGMGEHYQITELDIPMIAVHPNGNDIAVYETDGFSIHRVSVWNWPSLSRKFVKTYTNNIISLNFTGKGTLLAVGTATVNGMEFLNPSTGRTVSKIKEATGIVSMFYGSASEKSAVLYSPTGSLTYYNMTNGSRKERFTTEAQLEQGTLLNNNLFFAGVKNNQIYIIDALSGKTSARVSARSPILLSDGGAILYYVETDGRNYTLKAIETKVTEESSTIANPSSLYNLSGINTANTITSGFYSKGKIVLGSKAGNIFSVALGQTENAGKTVVVTENMYDKIYDIASINNDFYFLTKDTIFLSSYNTGQIDTVAQISGFTNIIPYGNNVLLWSRGTKKAVVLLDLQTKTTKNLFTPKNYVENLRLFGNKLVYIEGSTTVNLYDMDTHSNSELYTGTGIQDVVLYHGDELYVAKSASSTPRSPLISVNTVTKETVMLPLDGSVAFSLSLDQENNSNVIYGIQATSQGSNSQTTIFAFYPERKTSTAIMKVAGEDVNAFLTMYGSTIYTNIGKSQIRSYDTKQRREVQLNRSASLPLKLARSGNHIAVLNRDGSISWYNAGNGTVLADWYMTTEKQWFEF